MDSWGRVGGGKGGRGEAGTGSTTDVDACIEEPARTHAYLWGAANMLSMVRLDFERTAVFSCSIICWIVSGVVCYREGVDQRVREVSKERLGCHADPRNVPRCSIAAMRCGLIRQGWVASDPARGRVELQWKFGVESRQ